MKRYFGGNQVSPGMYLNLKSVEFCDLTGEPAVLPGTNLDKFARVPRILPFIAGPVGGLFFIIFLPLAGIVALASASFIKLSFMQNLMRRVGHRSPDVIK